jgi:hypothetical protein
MISPDEYEEWYAYARYDCAEKSVDELISWLKLIADVCIGKSKKYTKREIKEFRKRWDFGRRTSVKYRAAKDELAERALRFDREFIHEQVDYDS